MIGILLTNSEAELLYYIIRDVDIKRLEGMKTFELGAIFHKLEKEFNSDSFTRYRAEEDRWDAEQRSRAKRRKR